MRHIVGGLLVVVLAAAGCAAPENDVRRPEAEPSVSLPADPGEALALGAEKLGEQSARIEYSYAGGKFPGTKFTGVVDASGTTYEVAGDFYIVRRIGDDIWLKVTKMPPVNTALPFLASELNKWAKKNPNHVDSTTSFGEGFPWVLPAQMLRKAEGVSAVGDRSYRGKVSAGPKAKGADLTAALDQAGRPTSVAVGVEESPGDVFTAKLWDYGVPVTVEPPPAAEVVEDSAVIDFVIIGVY
ncbi:hypothetical protein ACQPZJ_36090 [Actinoplanes sp. CA-054009]